MLRFNTICVHYTANEKTEYWIYAPGDGDHDKCHVRVINNYNQTCVDSCGKLLPIRNYDKPRKPQFCINLAFEKLFASRKGLCPRTSIRAYFLAKWRIFFLDINKQIIPVSIGVPLTCKGSIYSQKQSLSQSGRDYEIIPIDLDLCSIRFFL